MPSLQDIRRRIRSIKNTAQITKAMEMVAASRMRRAQERVLASRPYSETLRSLIAELSTQGKLAGQLHPILVQREVDTVGVVLITADRGLCGALNTNTIRRGAELILEQEESAVIELVTVGRKGQDFMARRGRKLLGTFAQLGDRPEYMQIVPIARVITDSYQAGVMDACFLVYPRFVSTLVQRPQVEQLLPVQPSERIERPVEYIYEPDPFSILSALLPRYLETLLYQAVLEAVASEQSARMVAMRNATENANDLVQDLTLSYNKARQAAITREVTEIASAAEAMAWR